jgi:hypothetical protein
VLGHNPESYDFISKIPRIININFSLMNAGIILGLKSKFLWIEPAVNNELTQEMKLTNEQARQSIKEKLARELH